MGDKKRAILIVDDERPVRELISMHLAHLDQEITTVSSAEAALAVLKLRLVDLVLLDIALPGKSGIDLLETIASDYPETLVVMVTGNDELDTVLSTLRRGAFDYIHKPFRPKELEACVVRALGRRRLQLENRAYQKSLEDLVSERTQALEQTLQELRTTYDQTIRALGAALDLRDTATEHHCARVARFAIRLAREMGIDDDDVLRDLEWGSYLHDIGKIGVPDAILKKPGPLTEAELEAIRQHPTLGQGMLQSIPFLHRATDVVQYHHERYDGCGYPEGIAGEDIPRLARIFSVADTVDAMISDRPYSPAMEFVAVREEIVEQSGRQFDPKVVEAFLAIPDEQWARLSSISSLRMNQQAETDVVTS